MSGQWYPRTRKEEIPLDFTPYQVGDDVFIDCTARNIDTGEHKFDDKERILYVPFPTCKETGKPLSLKYGVSDDVNCTINFTDELYHLFQLYIHEDVPFSCRLPVSNEQNYLEKGGAWVPLTFNFRGEIHDSHLDIDRSMNVLVTKPAGNKVEENSFISAVAFGAGTNATRIIIGDSLTLNLAVRWYNQIKPLSVGDLNVLPYADGFYKFPTAYVPISYNLLYFYLGVVGVLSSLVTFLSSYKLISRKFKGKFKAVDEEIYGKQD